MEQLTDKQSGVTAQSLAKKYGVDLQVVDGSGGEYCNGGITVGSDTTPMRAFAADWTTGGGPDFKTKSEYPDNASTAAHEIAHSLFSEDPAASHVALKAIQALGVPDNVAFESLVDLGGLSLLEKGAITNPELNRIISKWLSPTSGETMVESRVEQTIPKADATAFIQSIRSGDERSKYGGKVYNETEIGDDLVVTTIPISDLNPNTRDWLDGSTNKDRVAEYEKQKIGTPVYVKRNQKGRLGVRDGGHRTMAAINRGDDTIRVVMTQSDYDQGKDMTEEQSNAAADLILEKLSSFNYKLPKEVDQQLWDFYLMTLLPKSDDEILGFVADESKEDLYNSLKTHLLDSVFFAVCAEARHIFGNNSVMDILGKLEESDQKLFRAYTKNLAILKDSNAGQLMRDAEKVTDLRQGNSTSYNNSYRAAEKAIEQTGSTQRAFVELTYQLFDRSNFTWAGSFGGKPWQGISEGWVMLDDAETLPQMQSAIDHVYDLQHNTDTVFNKLKAYYKEGFGWIGRALDQKKFAKTPYFFFDKVSPQMKRLAGYVLKDTQNTTFEEWSKATRGGADEESEVKKEIQNAKDNPAEDHKGDPKSKTKEKVSTIVKPEETNDKIDMAFEPTPDDVYGLDAKGTFVWGEGNWVDGYWGFGLWEDGNFEHGTWDAGIWKKGTWWDGTWHEGTWEDGEWRDGLWKNGSWYKGTWLGGTWEDGTWEDGTWKDGVWRDGWWEKGTWEGGTWEGGAIWSEKENKWLGSDVNPTEFNKTHGKPKKVEPKGKSTRQQTAKSTALTITQPGKKNSWIDMDFTPKSDCVYGLNKYGDFVWEAGTWEGGVWKSGYWVNGTWEGGRWKKGVWYDGEWEGGKWEGGYIFSEKNDEAIASDVSPKEFYKVYDKPGSKEKKDSIIVELGKVPSSIEMDFEPEDDCVYGLDKYGSFVWEAGYWHGGTWGGGTWVDGTWKKGIWRNGSWYGGTWENGLWKNGSWYKGTWLGGTWLDGVWQDGLWETGVWSAGVWNGGTWKTGSIYSEIGASYKKSPVAPEQFYKTHGVPKTKYGGAKKPKKDSTKPKMTLPKGSKIVKPGKVNDKIKMDFEPGPDCVYGLDSSGDFVWESGAWKGGTWGYGTWNDGTWEDGIWEGGHWKDGWWWKGTWEFGAWGAGKWVDGVWNDGIWKIGTWEDGTWKDGSWYNGNWYDGTWDKGVWSQGKWHGGTWNGGKWLDGSWAFGDWNGGKWVEGDIFSPDKGWYSSSLPPAPSSNQKSGDGKKSNAKPETKSKMKIPEWSKITQPGKINMWIKMDFEPDEDCVYGLDNDGKFVWAAGVWSGGTWKGGVWEGGVWEEGNWYAGNWMDGEWEGGTWHNGHWFDGHWTGGVWKKGIWEFGNWDGERWEDGVWRDGTWNGGYWDKGVWKDGTWNGGEWREGTWESGTWAEGLIYSPEKKMWLRSDVSPKDFHDSEEIEEKINMILEQDINGVHLDGSFFDASGNLFDDIRQVLQRVTSDLSDDLREKGFDLGDSGVVLTGSLLGPNWDDASDADFHILVDFEKYGKDEWVYREYLALYARSFNARGYTLAGRDLELYFQDAKEPHFSPGVYDIVDGLWVDEPTLVDQINISDKVKTDAGRWKTDIEELKKESEKVSFEDSEIFLDKVNDIFYNIREMRAAGIAGGGVGSDGNQVFKQLRRNETLQILSDLRKDFENRVYDVRR